MNLNIQLQLKHRELEIVNSKNKIDELMDLKEFMLKKQ
jgi:hypothetical protein